MQQDYVRKSRILRRIMSNKASYYKKMNTLVNVLTVVVASLVTFVGFYGADKVHAILNGSDLLASSFPVFSFVFNLVTFALLVLVFLQIFFRYGDRQGEAERAIVSLSSFINFVRDRSNETGQSEGLSSPTLEVVRERYEAIISSIPANTDSEYEKARNEESISNQSQQFLFLQSIGQPADEVKILERIVSESKTAMKLLSEVRAYRVDLWIAGGIFRNLVWDRLHSYEIETPIDDVDIVYFDKDHADISVDRRIEADLAARSPGIVWSVKNQARMHIHNSDPPYNSLADAVSKFPETCSAFAIRIDGNKEMEIVSPHGLTDLLCLVVRPTPHFVSDPSRIVDRLKQKEWTKKWPKLRVFLK